MAANKKQYGLVISQKKKATFSKSSVFENDSSDEEGESARREFSSSLHREGIKKMQSKANREAMADALAEDPTVYEYDAIYDQLQEQKKKTNAKLQGNKDTKSRYIASLKRTAELRKIEQDMAYERRMQKELEAEGELYSDKDAFVTGAYKKKLEERAAMEKRLQEEEQIEKVNDVTKQNDLGRMYKHLLDQKTSGSTNHKDVIHTAMTMPNEAIITSKGDKEEKVAQPDLVVEPVRSEEKDELQPSEESPLPIRDEDNEITRDVNIAIEKEDVKDNSHIVEEVKESKEDRLKRLFAKRTSTDAALSAKERYLARKRANVPQPTIANDDD